MTFCSVKRLVVCLSIWLSNLSVGAVPTNGQQNPDGKLILANYGNPLILLLRDSEVWKELKVTPNQQAQLRALADEVDLLVWPARNQSREAAHQAWAKATDRVQQAGGEILSSSQRQRIEQIILWIQGPRALARDDVAETLQLDEGQRADLRSLFEKTQTQLDDLQKQAQSGEPLKPLETKAKKLQTDEQQQVLKQLNETQRGQWSKMAGPRVELGKLGKVTFSAPPLQASTTDWLEPTAIGSPFAGQVTAVHFFANGCINCQRNYPHYLKWQQSLVPKGLQIVGIHTPETAAEHDRHRLQERARAAGFTFPILVDNELKNWNAWGNSMWPSVYLVDRQGRIRYWWYGELNWQGQEGEQRMRQRIEELLAEGRANSRP